MSIPCESPAYGVLIECVMEDDPRYGSTSWIDLLTVETSEDIQEIIDSTTGRDQDPYPDSWNEEGTFEVSEVRGLGPRLSAYAKDVVGPFVDTLTALATALQILSPEQRVSFLAWAELSSWPPGYLPDTGGHTSEDVVELFLCETADFLIEAPLSDEQEFGLKKLEFGLRKTIQHNPEEVLKLSVSLSRLLRQSERLVADLHQQIGVLQLKLNLQKVEAIANSLHNPPPPPPPPPTLAQAREAARQLGGEDAAIVHAFLATLGEGLP